MFPAVKRDTLHCRINSS